MPKPQGGKDKNMIFHKLKTPYFSELDSGGGDDFELDFSEESVEEPEGAEVIETEEDTKPKGDVTDPEPYKLKVKYNHEDMELGEEEAIPLIQKGMNYDKAIERAAQEAKQQAIDEYIAAQGYEWNGNPITTESQYQQALYEQELASKGVDPTEIQRLVGEHPDVRRAMEIAEAAEQEELSTKEYKEFISEYPDVRPEDIPKEVFEYQAQTGKPLLDCMRYNELRILKEQNKTLKQNKENSKRAPVGSVTTFGSDDPNYDPFLDGFNSI
ncbi:hypothetical protein [Anaerovorax sp. IOR16]|uniref:hypothetical protein n=1 Tax=Anaerovorax sp. IOR16 TaxID=2773458 RepID=UPI0019CF86D0|nr:hypothetical protein [Anaerovorax sp. IOR16]